MQLGSGVAVAVVQAGNCSSDLTPSSETSICHRCSPKKRKKKKKEGEKKILIFQRPVICPGKDKFGTLQINFGGPGERRFFSNSFITFLLQSFAVVLSSFALTGLC